MKTFLKICAFYAAVFGFFALAIIACLCWFQPAEAQWVPGGGGPVYSTTSLIPFAPFVSTVYPGIGGMTGGTITNNQVNKQSTNSHFWSTPLDVRNFKHFDVVVAISQVSNVSFSVGQWTNTVVLTPSYDGVNLVSSNAISLTFIGGSFTNLLWSTNLSGPVTEDVGYWFCSVGCSGTNTTDVSVAPFVKPGTYDN